MGTGYWMQAVIIVALSLLGFSPTRAGNLMSAGDFMNECLITSSERMCDCISAKLPPEQRGAATAAMHKSNAASKTGGNLLDPSLFDDNEMMGLAAVVTTQASCH